NLAEKVNHVPPILVLLPSHKHNVHVDVNTSNQRLFGRRKLGQSEIRLVGAAFLILSIATRTNAIAIDLHLEPTLLASTAKLHLVIVQLCPELAEDCLVATSQGASLKVSIPHRVLCVKYRRFFRWNHHWTPIPSWRPRRSRQDHGDHALAVRKAAVSDGEEGFHPRNYYRRSRLRPTGSESHSTPNCLRYLRGRAGERSKLK
ncbi:hypothetical protein BGZ61DRAFT_466402, partial [Ilyonectria robusta]|uniref:uncharacterized protein n=1 Tax=Ilyonectria robusta TaxID=1079257 RepID=UPI001E8E7F7B